MDDDGQAPRPDKPDESDETDKLDEIGTGEPATVPDRPVLTPRRRLLIALQPRLTQAQLLAGLLCFVLGFAVVVQVRQAQNQPLAGLRQAELVRVLDDVSGRSQRLEDEQARLTALQARLRSGSDSARAARQAAQERLDVLSVLAGTARAKGPGITLTIADPRRQVGADVLLDTLQELRDAGAEAVQIGDVRVVAETSFTDDPQGVRVDGTVVRPPYAYVVLGAPATLAAALDIPGGVLEVLRQKGATGTVTQSQSLTVTAVRAVTPSKYLTPVEQPPS